MHASEILYLLIPCFHRIESNNSHTHHTKTKGLSSLDNLYRRRRELSSEDCIPETTCDTKSILVVLEVVLQMVLLKRLVERWELFVVQEVVGQIIADIAKDTSAEDSCSYVPVPIKDNVCEFPEGKCQDHEQRWRHDQPQFIHRKVVVNTMQEEMKSQGYTVVWEPSVFIISMI